MTVAGPARWRQRRSSRRRTGRTRRTARRLRLAAAAAGGGNRGVTLGDFYAYMPKHLYIFAPTGEMWPATSINARLPRYRS